MTPVLSYLPRAAALASMLALATPAWSAAPNPELGLANEAYTGLRFEAALEHLRRAMAQPNDRATLLQILELRGLTLAVLSEWRRASVPYRQLLTLDPAHQLPDYVAPRFRSHFEQVRKNAAAAGWLEARDVTPARAARDDPTFVLLRLENDPMRLATQARVQYRLEGDKAWVELQVPVSPTTQVRLETAGSDRAIEYVWTLLDDTGNELAYLGTRSQPQRLGVIADVQSAASNTPIWQRWWLWTAVGVVVVGAAATTAVLVAQPDTPACPPGVNCASF